MFGLSRAHFNQKGPNLLLVGMVKLVSFKQQNKKKGILEGILQNALK